MVDVFSPKKRSEVMSKIRSSGNRSTEERLATLFRRHHVSGWRRNWDIFGKPDFVFPSQRVAIFVDGCFWHSCPQPSHCKIPATRTEWWVTKLERTK
jgi:DNA mismatch endonuclease, patch repair protein